MSKPQKRIYIPDAYVGFLILPVIAIINLVASALLNPIADLIKDFAK